MDGSFFFIIIFLFHSWENEIVGIKAGWNFLFLLLFFLFLSWENEIVGIKAGSDLPIF